MIKHRSESVGPARALLVCIAEERFSRDAAHSRGLHELEANGAMLLEEWEKAELPVIFVERPLAARPERSFSMSDASNGEAAVRAIGAADFSDPRRRPRPGDFVFQSDLQSLLRHRRFYRLFEDLGGPLLILFGDELGAGVMETAIDGFLSGHPIIIVKDAAPLGLGNIDATLSVRSTALPLLSCFARLMKTDELLSEWTAP
ncbi:MAG: hypothetical protein C3F11_19675 [Methylocystaceae bacterium]|nr:MAG: hypothetical protein C3F11_19675 [Methylocystaceae bacterium]